MNESGIVVENVWKKFRRGQLHDSLRDLVPAVAKRLVGRGPKRDQLDQGDFWALKDISFQVRPGEALGIIGPNGAGKSTLLKILNGILRPNRGRVEVRGRVGALIEIAAGFHPDLTGRENIFLQGAIMGMKRIEIAAKFDDIVDFSGIADFIDTPVKRYSSGMNARLGFSIAAHLDPEVLLIDEVLAVGDHAFQRRAFDRLHTVVRSGIPVVVVSHQLPRIASLCDRAILLRQGIVAVEGKPSDCISTYVSGDSEPMKLGDRPGIAIAAVEFDPAERVRSGDRLRVTVAVRSEWPIELNRYDIGFVVRSMQSGDRVYWTGPRAMGYQLPCDRSFRVEGSFQMNLPAGIYGVETSIWDVRQQRTVADGPKTVMEIFEDPSFNGDVQLNGAFVLTSSDARMLAR